MRPSYRYDPRSRPWYALAAERNTQVLTAPYLFFTTQEVGVTLTRIFPPPRATTEYGIGLVCPKIQVSNLDQRAGNAEAKLYRRN